MAQAQNLNQSFSSTPSGFTRQLISRAFDFVRSSRSCPALSDPAWIEHGLSRVLHPQVSGREHLQFLADLNDASIARQTWFDAFQSPRRQATLAEWGSSFFTLARSASTDRLCGVSELEGWDVHAIDGHYVSHASHEDKPARAQRKTASGLLYALDLRGGMIRPLAPVNREEDAGCRHEWPVLREALGSAPALRTVHVVDRAFTDSRVWLQMARKGGPYVVIRAKSNAQMICLGDIPFDANDPVNAGVIRYQRIGFNNGTSGWTRVEYHDEETGQTFIFLSTLPDTFRPGVIALLHRLRWRIEKSFDVFKNKLGEDKNWSCGNGARQAVGWLIASAYNLLQWVSGMLEQRGVTEKKAEKKYTKWKEKTHQGKGPPPLPKAGRLVQMTCQFIRMFRNHWRSQKSLEELLPLFRSRMEAYL